jgi:hypothetical protein
LLWLALIKSKLEQVEAGEYEYPNQVYKVPVQTSFLDHQVVASAVEYSPVGHDKHNDIDNNTREYVEAMETCDGKEEIGKVGRCFGTVEVMEWVHTPPGALIVQVMPLPSLTAEECNTAYDGPE